MFQNITPVTRNIIVINIIFYIVSNFLQYPALYDALSAYFPVSPNFHWWQVITHMFMHAPFKGSGSGVGIMHIVFNMMTLFSFGPVLERNFGAKKFLFMYFLSGIGAFVLFNVWEAYEIYGTYQSLENQGVNIYEIFAKSKIGYEGDQEIFANPKALKLGVFLNNKMLGASGAIFGLFTAFGILYPDSKLTMMFIPIQIKAKILVPFIVVGSILLGIFSKSDGIAHFAHVGGAIVGYLFAKQWQRNRFRIN